MIRIEITAAAYEAIIASGVTHPLEPLRSPSGGYFIYLTRQVLDRLAAARGPGESYSDAILRLARETA
jgi:hypothetical protein